MNEATDSEKEYICAAIMSAARRIGMDLAYFTDKGRHRYIWGDPTTATVIEGPVMDNQKDALFYSCLGVQQYFNPNEPKQSSPSNKDQDSSGRQGA